MTEKMNKFVLLSLLVIVGRVYDVTTTYLYTPDLKNESNIIVKFLGAGWTSVLIVQASLVGLTLYLLHYYFFKYKPDRPSDPNLTLRQYASHLFFGDTVSFNRIFYKIPKNKKTFLASTGYIVSMTLISISFIVGTSTTMLLISDHYKLLYKQGIPYILYTLIIGLAIWFSISFFKIQYKKYQSGHGLQEQ